VGGVWIPKSPFSILFFVGPLSLLKRFTSRQKKRYFVPSPLKDILIQTFVGPTTKPSLDLRRTLVGFVAALFLYDSTMMTNVRTQAQNLSMKLPAFGPIPEYPANAISFFEVFPPSPWGNT